MHKAIWASSAAVWLLAASPGAIAQTGLSFPNLAACRASEVQYEAAAKAAEAHADIISLTLSDEFSRRWDAWQKALQQLSAVRSTCAQIEAARRSLNGELRDRPLNDQTSEMNRLHEILSDNVLKAVPSATTRKIQEQNLGVVRSQMADLAKIMDNSIAAIGAQDTAGPRSRSSTSTLVGHPDPAVGGVLGAGAADTRVPQQAEDRVRSQAATLQQQLQGRASTLVDAAEAEIDKSSVSAGRQLGRSRMTDIGSYERVLAEQRGGNASDSMATMETAVSSLGSQLLAGDASRPQGGTSERCQQTLAQIEENRRAFNANSGSNSSTAREVNRQIEENTRDNQTWYDQNCR